MEPTAIVGYRSDFALTKRNQFLYNRIESKPVFSKNIFLKQMFLANVIACIVFCTCHFVGIALWVSIRILINVVVFTAVF